MPGVTYPLELVSRRSVLPTWSIYEKRTVFNRSGGRCHICKRHHTLAGYGRDWNMEHLQPRSRGGSDDVRNLAVACIACNSNKGNNFDMSDLATGVANEVVDRLRGGATPIHSSRGRASHGGQGRGQSSNRGRGGRIGGGSSRRGPCAICGEVRNLIGSFCNNCNQKSRNRPMQKRDGECAYGRCVQPVKSQGFLGFGATPYCERHQNQHDRGLI